MAEPEGWDPDALRELLEEHIPFNKHLGLKVTHLSPDSVTLMVPFKPEFVGDPLRPALTHHIGRTLCRRRPPVTAAGPRIRT